MNRHELFTVLAKDVEETKGVFVIEKTATYLRIIHNGYLIYIQENDSAVDENHPGEVMFMVYEIAPSGCNIVQSSYWENFTGMHDVDSFLEKGNITPVEGAVLRALDVTKVNGTAKQGIEYALHKYGAKREWNIWKNAHFVSAGDTWNKEHKVVDVLELIPQEDGYRDGFSVDLVTGSICG